MIYIFEDRASRRELYQEIVDKYKWKICFGRFDIDEGMSLEEYLKENFQDSEIFIFHKSYVFKHSKVNIDEIRRRSPSIRFVVFSGGTENGVIAKDGDVLINADLMYGNLEEFVKAYNEVNDIDLGLLIWGKQLRLNQILSFQTVLFRKYFIRVDLDSVISKIEIEDKLGLIAEEGDAYGLDLYDNLQRTYEQFPNIPLRWKDLLEIIQKTLTLLKNEL